MKIIYIANIRIPTEKAHGVQIMKMCEAFSRLYSIELIVPTKKDTVTENKDPFSYYGVEKSFVIKKIWSLDPYWLMKLPQGIYIKFQILFFLARVFLYLCFLKNKDDIIFYTRDEYMLPLLQRFSKKVVWEAHTLPKNAKYYARYWKSCIRIIAITSFLKNELVGHGVEEKKIQIEPDGVDVKKFGGYLDKEANRKKFGLPLNKIIILYTGHLYDWKGADTLAQACDSLPSSYACVFIGGTQHDIEEFKIKNKDKKNMHVLGHKPHEDMPAYLSTADMLIIPNSGKSNISKFYTSPMKFFEYLSTDKPILASDLPTLREIGDKFSGVYYFIPDDEKDLAQKIQQIDTQKTYERDLAKFSWDERSKRIIEFINKL